MPPTKRDKFRDFINECSVDEFDVLISDVEEILEMFDDEEVYPNAFHQLRKLYRRLHAE